MLIEKLESDIPSARLSAMDVFVSFEKHSRSQSNIENFRFIVLTNMMREISAHI